MIPDASVASIGPVHIIGTGLIGTSVGLALTRVGVEVTVSDLDHGVASEAARLGAGRLRHVDDPPPRMVIAATPPARVGEVLAEAGRRWEEATLTDVASVKSSTMADALDRGAPPDRLIGGHPMAGREVSGPAGGRADLFDDRIWVVCPAPGADPARVHQVKEMVGVCGAASVEMAPQVHDAAVAVISHAPQVLASTLAGRLVGEPDAVVAIAGQGLRDMTRIADSDPRLWEEILRWNAASVSTVLADVIEDLSDVVADLRGSAPSGEVDLRGMLERGAVGRQRIPGKHGGRERQFEVVSVMVKDEPGELARLFVAAGELGVNLEDVRIEHVLGRPSGLIDLSVRPRVAQELRDGLHGQGFDVRA